MFSAKFSLLSKSFRIQKGEQTREKSAHLLFHPINTTLPQNKTCVLLTILVKLISGETIFGTRVKNTDGLRYTPNCIK